MRTRRPTYQLHQGDAVEWLRSRGMPRVILWTADGNTGAQRLFEQRGFRRTMVEMTRELG